MVYIFAESAPSGYKATGVEKKKVKKAEEMKK